MTGSYPKTIGIIGGMGPAATVAFMQRIIAATEAEDDGDHLRMIVDNNPKIPSRIAAIIDKTGADPLPHLVAMAQGLEKAGAGFLVMPCNTAHHYHARVAQSVGIPFPSMVEVAVAHVASEFPRVKNVGFLASPAVRDVAVYHECLTRRGLTPVYPDAAGNERLLAVIKEIKSGKIGDAQVAAFHEIADACAAISDVVLVACTELSILPMPITSAVPVIDTLDLLAGATIETATGKRDRISR